MGHPWYKWRKPIKIIRRKEISQRNINRNKRHEDQGQNLKVCVQISTYKYTQPHASEGGWLSIHERNKNFHCTWLKWLPTASIIIK